MVDELTTFYSFFLQCMKVENGSLQTSISFTIAALSTSTFWKGRWDVKFWNMGFWRIPEFQCCLLWSTVDGSEIPHNHLGCFVKTWDELPTSTGYPALASAPVTQVSAFQRYGVVAFTGQQRVSVQQRHDDAVKLLERYLHEAQKHGSLGDVDFFWVAKEFFCYM